MKAPKSPHTDQRGDLTRNLGLGWYFKLNYQSS